MDAVHAFGVAGLLVLDLHLPFHELKVQAAIVHPVDRAILEDCHVVGAVAFPRLVGRQNHLPCNRLVQHLPGISTHLIHEKIIDQRLQPSTDLHRLGRQQGPPKQNDQDQGLAIIQPHYLALGQADVAPEKLLQFTAPLAGESHFRRLGLGRLAHIERLVEQRQRLPNLGAELGTPNDLHHKLNFQIAQQQVSQLEIDIDTLENELPPIRQFILPGGTFSSSVLHLARTVCRRCERRVVALSKDQPVSRETFQYLNRLSDLLFVLARTADAEIGVADVFWTQPSPQQR